MNNGDKKIVKNFPSGASVTQLTHTITKMHFFKSDCLVVLLNVESGSPALTSLQNFSCLTSFC